MLQPEYKENVKNLNKIRKDEPMTSREKAAWWVEYVIRNNGTKHFEYSLKNIPIYEKYFLDIAGIAILILFIIVKLIIFAFSKMCKGRNEKLKRK
jgi:hypothetical protein